jgi:hypothetical protein
VSHNDNIRDPSPRWRRSSHSGGNNGAGGDCVELAFCPVGAAVRDSKNPGTALKFPRGALTAFLAELKHTPN